MKSIIDTKKAYQEKSEARIEMIEAKLAELRARAKEAQAIAKIELEDKINDLDERYASAKEKMAELKTSGEDSWEKLKLKIDGALDGIQDKLKEVV